MLIPFKDYSLLKVNLGEFSRFLALLLLFLVLLTLLFEIRNEFAGAQFLIDVVSEHLQDRAVQDVFGTRLPKINGFHF